ncbi:transposase [Enterococcus italicus]|uniref:transposase n=1 Tax=Enterococcus italicus TaxID=246144 RepID=UPI0028A8EBB5|nr:transposase [Enterococcus italicus]
MPKRYTDEFKMNSVELHKAGLKTPKQLSQEYGIGYSTVLKWCQDKKPAKSTGITPDDYKAQAKKMKQLEEENKILKKALSLLTRK